MGCRADFTKPLSLVNQFFVFQVNLGSIWSTNWTLLIRHCDVSAWPLIYIALNLGWVLFSVFKSGFLCNLYFGNCMNILWVCVWCVFLHKLCHQRNKFKPCGKAWNIQYCFLGNCPNFSHIFFSGGKAKKYRIILFWYCDVMQPRYLQHYYMIQVLELSFVYILHSS